MPTPEQIIALKKIYGDDYVPPTDEVKTDDNAGDGDEKKIEDSPITKTDPITTATTPNAEPKVVVTAGDDLDDARVLEYLKRKNISVASLDELAPKEDPTLIAEKRENEKLSYALGKSLFSKKDYESFVADKNSPDELVFKEYLRDALAEDPDANEEDIRNEFIDKYSINEAETSRKYKRGVHELALLSDKILRSKYGKIYNADHSYSQHEQELQRQREREKFLAQQTPKYKADIKEIMGNLKAHKMQLSDTEEFPLDFSDEYLQGLEQKFLDPAYMEQLVEKDYDKGLLAETVFLGALRENFPKILQAYSEKRILQNQRGVKGIVHVHTGTGKEDQVPVLNANQQKALNLMKERVERPLAN